MTSADVDLSRDRILITPISRHPWDKHYINVWTLYFRWWGQVSVKLSTKLFPPPEVCGSDLDTVRAH